MDNRDVYQILTSAIILGASNFAMIIIRTLKHLTTSSFMMLRVRPMHNDDLDAVHAIETSAHRMPWSREIIRDCIFVHYDCRVLEIDTDTNPKLAGYIISRCDGNSYHILNLCVAPALQGKRYGQFLLQNILDSQQGNSIEKIILEVRPSNLVALHLYQKMGFQQIGIKKDYYKDEQSAEDGVVLEKKINYGESPRPSP